MGVVLFIRQGVLGVTILFSLVELAVTANFISQTEQDYGLTLTFCALALAVAAISVVTLPVMLVVDLIRRGAFSSMIVVEITWLYILCILWVASAGETITGFNLNFPLGCIYGNAAPTYNEMCQETQAMAAFSFLNFIILLVYASVVFVMAVIAATRGQSVWLSSVKESFGPFATPVERPMTQYNSSAAPQPQVVYGGPASTV